MVREKGFTLIELLVVVAVIALLLSMMAPIMPRIFALVEKDTCQSNLHQLGIAHSAYLAEYRNRFVPFRWWIAGGYTDIAALANPAQSRIYPYVQNARFFLCPTFRKVCAPNAVRSYVMQHSFGDTEGWYNGAAWGNGYSIDSVVQVKDPSRLCIVTEEATWMVHVGDTWYSRYAVNDAHLVTPDWPNRDTIAQFHYPGPGPIDQQIEGVGNVDFVDGHVAPVVTTQTPYVISQNWY